MVQDKERVEAEVLKMREELINTVAKVSTLTSALEVPKIIYIIIAFGIYFHHLLTAHK